MTEPPEYPPPSPYGEQPPPPFGQQPAYPPPMPAFPTPNTSYPPHWNQQNPGSIYAPPSKPGTNGFAIAALVLGIIGGCLLSVIFGIVALRQIGKTGQGGRGMAIAGLVLSGVWVVVLIAVGASGVLDQAERDSTGRITDPGKVFTQDLAVGDCINDLKADTVATRIPAVPCSEPHQGEVFAEIKLTESRYPGEDALQDRANKSCFYQLKTLFPKIYKDENYGVFYFAPTERSWALGDRVITCATKTEGKRSGSIND